MNTYVEFKKIASRASHPGCFCILLYFRFSEDTPLANYTYLAGGMKIKAETGFGARHLSPALRSWMVPDPMSEKYYGLSPYSYCGGNPVMFVDPDGEDWWDIAVGIASIVGGTCEIL